MSIRNLIILSQVNPPAQRSHVLLRERVSSLLKTTFKYPLSVLQAGTGYGKSTAIISFVNTIKNPVYWFTISGSDRDPTLFLAKLFTAFNQRDEGIGDEALRILDMPDGTQQEAMIALINAIAISVTEESLLILDDFHRVSDVDEILRLMDWMIEHLPPRLHILLSTRRNVDFPSLNKWRVTDTIFESTRDDLVFTRAEIHALFEEQYQISLTDEDTARLQDRSEGWAIGLQMIWQTLKSHPEKKIGEVLEDDRESRTALFDYLAHEVLARQPEDVQQFLLRTSILSRLDSATCDFLLMVENSNQILDQLNRTGLFIEELRPGVYRYHHIFQEFLLNRLHQNPLETVELHRKIASYFTAHEYWEQAIFHLISASDFRQMSVVLENIGANMIQEGRHESIRYWIQEIPIFIRQNYPYINYLMGEVHRYTSQFNLALESYHTAERLYRALNNNWGISLALQGQARVYLDTVRPVNADQILQDALQLLDPYEDPQQYANLLVLTAENQLNLGNPDSAERLLDQARLLLSDIDNETDLIKARILLRTGDILGGIHHLESRKDEATGSIIPLTRPQRFHREASLLLSLFYALTGDVEKCEYYAQRGIIIGESLQSTFVQSVGYMRIGHALQLRNRAPWNKNGFTRAMEYYQLAMDKVDVTRIHVEPLWGMCRALGYSGHIEDAEEQAATSLEIAAKAGDQWIGLLIRLSLGAGQVLSGSFEEAQDTLTIAESTALTVKDPFALCIARIWLALATWHQDLRNMAFAYLEKALPLIQRHNYEFLLIKETLLGLQDRETIMPLLIAAKQNNIKPTYIDRLLQERSLNLIEYHPGYSLWVQTLGQFEVWRGGYRIEMQEWKREKSRQFFQILVANREKWLSRDLILTMLWPDTPTETAARNLKVVLNQLNQVLEPDRPRGTPPFFVERSHELYRLNPNATILIDAEVFEKEAGENQLSALEDAIQLYQGRYFEGSTVQEWLTVEEQYYHQQFLMAAERLTNLLLERNDLDKGLQVTYQMLTQDQTCEPAYGLQMQIFHKMGQDSMVRTTYKQCQKYFRKNFGTDVSPKIQGLFEELVNSEVNP
ncbi:MAG: BTAD domain-containing putative transcriptional regulator [Anaerolineae bacterium]|jgi:ATP/maltotriose-dependent transcriptional regulator MalT/DNA-binding SARP family transcriptional activator|nr:BTAD domain-containing putative transcriptional regulator [Anaerolineae bacterium]